MKTQPQPLIGGSHCEHAQPQPIALFDRGASARTCVICSGALADHSTGEHASRVVERLAALGYPTPVNIGIP